MTEINENRQDYPIIVIIILKTLILIMFIYPLIHYVLIKDGNVTNDDKIITDKNFSLIQTDDDKNNTNNKTKQNSDEETKPKLIKPKIIQPSCPLSDHFKTILREICQDLYIKRELCTKQDITNLEKHKIPKTIAKNHSTVSSEPRSTIVSYLAAGLLLTSLGAAIVELYKAKSQSSSTKTKPSMSRKCSLADLTVLKHNRKELVRRESILEIQESTSSSSGSGPLKQLGRKVSRPPLRLD